MLVRGTLWHSLVLTPALSATLALAGCYALHERTEPIAELPRADAGASPIVPTVPPRVDAGSPPAVDRCAELFAAIRAGAAPGTLGCDGRTFEHGCVLPVGACCQLAPYCAIDPGDGGTVQWSLDCDDDCDQSCGAQTMDDCAFYPYCEPFDPGACGPAPEGVIEGPACITRRGSRCDSDADCADTGRCQSYWINPCLGLACDACGGEERRCAG